MSLPVCSRNLICRIQAFMGSSCKRKGPIWHSAGRIKGLLDMRKKRDIMLDHGRFDNRHIINNSEC
jgi:hypothetical protein